MSPTMKVVAIGIVAIYLVVSAVVINQIMNRKRAEDVFKSFSSIDTRKTFAFEQMLQRKLNIPEDKMPVFVVWERIAIAAIAIVAIYQLRGLAVAIFGAFAVAFFADASYKGMIQKSGITSIPEIVNFINNFIPKLTSGESADQAFLNFVHSVGSESLLDYYQNQDNPDFVPASEADSQIIEIYNVAKYNESIGTDNYTTILQDMLKDINQKQTYYNTFNARIGEIKPVSWAYYIGVPVLIWVSFSNTGDFWTGVGGWIVSLALLGLFALFKFALYRIQKKSVLLIF